MSGEAQNSEAAAVSAIRAEALLMMKEHKFSSVCIVLFLLLNFFGQIFFYINGVDLFAKLSLAVNGALLSWSLAERFSMRVLRVLRFYGAFCAGLFACLAFDSAVMFCYWMILSVLTVRMPRSFTALFFLASLILLLTILIL